MVCLIVLLVLGVVTAVSAQTGGEQYRSEDLFRGKSLNELDAIVQTISSESERKIIEATQDFLARGGAPRTLRRVDQLSIAALPARTFDEARGEERSHRLG